MSAVLLCAITTVYLGRRYSGVTVWGPTLSSTAPVGFLPGWHRDRHRRPERRTLPHTRRLIPVRWKLGAQAWRHSIRPPAPDPSSVIGYPGSDTPGRSLATDPTLLDLPTAGSSQARTATGRNKETWKAIEIRRAPALKHLAGEKKSASLPLSTDSPTVRASDHVKASWASQTTRLEAPVAL